MTLDLILQLLTILGLGALLIFVVVGIIKLIRSMMNDNKIDPQELQGILDSFKSIAQDILMGLIKSYEDGKIEADEIRALLETQIDIELNKLELADDVRSVVKQATLFMLDKMLEKTLITIATVKKEG